MDQMLHMRKEQKMLLILCANKMQRKNSKACVTISGQKRYVFLIRLLG